MAGRLIFGCLLTFNQASIRYCGFPPQNRFTDNMADGVEHDSLWHIPITFTSKADPFVSAIPKLWLSQRVTEISLDDVRPLSYFVVNPMQTGYFRTRYDDANYMLIANELSHGNLSSIPPNGRAALIDDSAVFVEANMLNIRILFELIKYLEHDIDYIPWRAATNNLAYMRRMLDDGSSRLAHDFKRFLRVLLAKTFEAFGVEEVEDEPHYHKHIRNIAINWACQAHLEACVNATRDKFDDFMVAKRVELSSDHESAIFCNGVQKSGEREFDFLWNLFNISTVATRRTFYLRSMGCIENESILTRLIAATLENDELDDDNNEWLTIIRAVYSNGPIGLSVALEFLRTRYDDFIGLLDELDSSRLSLNSVFLGIASRVNSVSTAKELTDLLVIYNIDEQTADNITVIIEKNLQWLATYSNDIQRFLDDFFRSGSAPASTFSCFIIVFGLTLNWIMQN